MTKRPSGVHKQVKEHSAIFASIAKRIDLAIIIQDKGMFFATNSILNLDVIFVKIVDKLGGFSFIFMSKPTLSMLIITKGINLTSAADNDGMIGSDCYFKGLFGEGDLFRNAFFLPEEEFAGLETESVEDFSC
jgi:hypothetical protein